jgi:hypothetical protein
LAEIANYGIGRQREVGEIRMLNIVLALVFGTDVSAQSSPETAKDPIICTRDPVGSEVGTHMRSKKVCMRKSDRDFIEKEQQATVREINNDGNDRLRAVTDKPR